MPKESKKQLEQAAEAQDSALVAAVKAAAGSSVNVTDDGQRLRVTASVSHWHNLWPKLAEIKPLTALKWEGCEQGEGSRTCLWVR